MIKVYNINTGASQSFFNSRTPEEALTCAQCGNNHIEEMCKKSGRTEAIKLITLIEIPNGAVSGDLIASERKCIEKTVNLL